MNFYEYRKIIDGWTELLADSGITLHTGKPVPITFWKTFLGVKRRVHQDIYNGKYKIKSKQVPTYLSQSIMFAMHLEKKEFIRQVKFHLPKFESDKES